MDPDVVTIKYRTLKVPDKSVRDTCLYYGSLPIATFEKGGLRRLRLGEFVYIHVAVLVTLQRKRLRNGSSTWV